MSQDALPHDQATQAALRHVDISKHGRPALEVADMVFTDPPYNVPVDGHVCGSGSIKHKEFAFASGEMTSGAPTLVKIHIRVCCLSCMALGP
jgi:16S rRNA G966 N2-methylase RsmD